MKQNKITKHIQDTLHNVSVESWSEGNISTEGIGDIFGKIKKTIKEWNDNRIRRRKKPDPMRHKNIQMSWYWIAREIRRTYLNATWLDARQPVEGPIDASKFITGLTYGDYVSPDSSLIVSAANQINKIITTFLPARKAYIESFEREVMDNLVNGRYNDWAGNVDNKKLTFAVETFFKSHGTVQDLVSRAIGKVKIALPESHSLESAFKGLKIVPGKVSLSIDSKLPPLSKDQIHAAASVLVEAVDKVPQVYLNTDALILNIIDDYVMEYVDEDSDEMKQELVMTSLDIKKAFALIRNDDLRTLLDEMSWNDHFYVPITTAFDQLVKGLISSEQYLASSIK